MGARASILRAVVATAATRVIPSVRNRLLILVPTLAGVEGEARVTVGTEASPEGGGVRRTFSPMRGLMDGHVLDTQHRRGVLAGVGHASPRNRALCLLSCHALKEHTQLDEDITSSDAHNTLLNIQGPITRAHVRQLNL
jgi:hypothetical protein